MGDRIEYKHLIIAIGLELNFEKIKGLPEALQEDPQVKKIKSSSITLYNTLSTVRELQEVLKFNIDSYFN